MKYLKLLEFKTLTALNDFLKDLDADRVRNIFTVDSSTWYIQVYIDK